MKTKLKLALALAVFTTTTCSGAEAATNATPKGMTSTGTISLTNIFSDWTDRWTNLTVAAPCPPWGCSRVFVLYERADRRPPMPAKKREMMQRLAERLQELKREEQQRRLRDAPALSEIYRVSFSERNNSIRLRQ